MEEIYSILKNRRINYKKLKEYGFEENNKQYKYKTILIPNELDITIVFSENGSLDYKVTDLISNDEYILMKITEAAGEYVGKVREACQIKLLDIINKCSETEVFKSPQAKQIIQYIKEKYNDEFEFLWKKSPYNAIVRRKDNKKWYAVLLTVTKNKLNLNGNESVEIINVKLPPEDIEKLVDNQKYFNGYHMNKKHWLTIILNGSAETKKIFEHIDTSYNIK